MVEVTWASVPNGILIKCIVDMHAAHVRILMVKCVCDLAERAIDERHN